MKYILEVGYNHGGDKDTAESIIDELAELKKKYPEIYGVKFQVCDVEGLPDNIKNKKRDDVNSFGKTYYAHRKALELKISELIELKKYTEERNLIFSCSGKDFKSFKNIIEKIKCKHVKVPSQFLLRHDIFQYIGSKKNEGLIVYVSFGMHNDDEIKGTKYWRWADVKYYCVSMYPPDNNKLNLSLLNKHPFNGYSSHEINGIGIPLAAINGAEYIERHYTLNKKLKGSDHKLSSDKKELKEIIETVRIFKSMMGVNRKVLCEAEIKNRMFYGGF
jgi:sialic acid synthase SpsE